MAGALSLRSGCYLSSLRWCLKNTPLSPNAEAMNGEELVTVAEDAKLTTALSFLCVGLVLIWGLRSASLVFAVLVTLACGLILTAAFATAFVGSLNLISVCFAVLVTVGQAHAMYTSGRRDARPAFCMPNPSPTLETVSAGFVAWAAAHPQYAEIRAVEGVLRFANATYPCTPARRR